MDLEGARRWFVAMMSRADDGPRRVDLFEAYEAEVEAIAARWPGIDREEFPWETLPPDELAEFDRDLDRWNELARLTFALLPPRERRLMLILDRLSHRWGQDAFSATQYAHVPDLLRIDGLEDDARYVESFTRRKLPPV